MKKLLPLACACLLLAAHIFSCGKADPGLSPAIYGEAFRRENEVLFYDEDCEHVLIHTSAAGISETIDANVYHMVRCREDNCGYEAKPEPHALGAAWLRVTSKPQYMENGYLYHRVPASCTLCGQQVVLYVYCPIQNKDCTAGAEENRCLADCDWGELLCDTPYAILYD